MFNLFQNFKQNNLNDLKSYVNQINLLEKDFSHLDETQIREKTNKLIKQFKSEKNFDSILVESFALTREASKRTLGLRHFDTQLMGGIVLHQGQIAEMKTGEGKTLVGTLPVVLNALSLKGIHVVTVNNYLAKRDKQWMSQLYRYLGLSVGLIQENMNSDERRKNYSADITYVTNSELVFDYLRDNMALSKNDLVLRDFNYAIIDEVDSILIDEARTPLIISGVLDVDFNKYIAADEVCNYLKSEIDYIVDEKGKSITLTSKGIGQVEKILEVTTLYDINDPWIPYINNALKAKILFLKDINYIVRNAEIVIIDEFTGRIMSDRRWSDGLHQAVEAKEQIPIQKESEVLSSVTYQNFFLSYPKFAGMTGTAKTAEAEFEKIYNRKVTVIPTARKMIRNDLPDLVYRDEFSKWKAIAKETYDLYKVGRPILIGTTSIEKSNIISELLKDLGVKHRLLNAKPENINFESEIIAQAGRKNAVTVATNMAGRGTDILLGGNADFQTKEQIFMFINELKTKNFYLLENKNILNLLKNKLVSKKGTNLLIAKKLETQIIFQKILIQYKKLNIPYSEFITSSQIIKYLNKNEIQNVIIKIVENNYLNIQNPIDIYLKVLYDYYYKKNQQNCLTEKQIVQKLGGLYVIGTELHESRRIDNQLRGRAGRQGDPGTSRFMISLEDNLFRIFVGDEIRKIMTQLQIDDDTPLQSGILSTVLENVQKKVENYYYDMRKRIFDYDEIINFQRISIYRERRALLKSKSIRREMIAYGEYLLSGLARELKKFELKNEKTNFYQLNKEISYLLGISYIFLNYEEVKSKNIEEITYLLIQQFWLSYDLKEAEFESFIPSLIRLLEKSSLLKEIDIGWKTHLQKAEILKETIGWRGYGQLDPLLEYKTEAFNLFLETNRQIKYNSIYNILKTQLKTNF